MLRVTGAGVEARVPGWLMNAAASHAAIRHAHRVAHELAARPERYGFDPAATYTAFVQSWDRAELNIRSIAFGRDVAGHDAVSLWPDPYYIASRGYLTVRAAAAGAPTWAARSGRFVWRGSVTGAGGFAAPEDIPRVRLALACRGKAETDVGLVGIHSTMEALIPVEATRRFIADHGLGREGWKIADFGNHRFAFDIDGHANAWGLLEKLILGCCVLKIASPFEQWYYPRLRPWVHYVPVKADLSDLPWILDWCARHDGQCEWIARNGRRLAETLGLENDLAESCRAFLSAAHPTRSGCSLPPGARQASDAIALEDAASIAEGEGRLDAAVVACSRLVDMAGGNVAALHQRSRLWCQQGRFAAALGDLERAVAADPGDDDALLALARFNGHIGRDMTAARVLAEVLRRTPASAEARVLLAASCIRLDRLDEAFRAVRHVPTDVHGWWDDLRRHGVERYSDRRAQAREMLRARRAMFPWPVEQAWDLAIALHALGRLHSAMSLCRLTMAHDPASFAPHELASRIIARRDGPAAALAYLAALPACFESAGGLGVRRAQLLFEMGEYQQVIELLRGRSDVSGDFLVRRMIAYSSILLDERKILIDHCQAWMTASPEDIVPAELVCAAQPLPGDIPSIGAAPPAPLEIAQFWHDEDVPASLREAMNSWSAHHPDIRRHVFHDASARAFLAAECAPDVVRAFDRCRDAASRASLLRYAWLHRCGGLWIAADQRCLRPADALLSRCADSEIATVRSGDLGGFLRDAMVGARRRSPVALAALQATVALAEDEMQPVPAVLLTRVVAAHLCEPGNDSDGVPLFAPIQWQRVAATVRRP